MDSVRRHDLLQRQKLAMGVCARLAEGPRDLLQQELVQAQPETAGRERLWQIRRFLVPCECQQRPAAVDTLALVACRQHAAHPVPSATHGVRQGL
jgi:hypothetical protein